MYYERERNITYVTQSALLQIWTLEGSSRGSHEDEGTMTVDSSDSTQNTTLVCTPFPHVTEHCKCNSKNGYHTGYKYNIDMCVYTYNLEMFTDNVYGVNMNILAFLF